MWWPKSELTFCETNRAKDLKEEEARFKRTLDPEVADVVKQKRLLLFAGF